MFKRNREAGDLISGLESSYSALSPQSSVLIIGVAHTEDHLDRRALEAEGGAELVLQVTLVGDVSHFRVFASFDVRLRFAIGLGSLYQL